MKNKQKAKLYVAYGSNLNLQQMDYRCPEAKVVGTSEIRDYALLFRGRRHGAVATVEPWEGEDVPVLVWEITPRDEAELDFYEGYPSLYEKQTINIELNGKSVSAMMYIMTPGREFGCPDKNYHNVIADGYRTAGFDLSTLVTAVDRSTRMMEVAGPEQNLSDGLEMQ